MNDDKSLDIVGAGRLARAIPAAAWKRLVETACVTFERLIAPVTELTSGVGRLIATKFNSLEAVEKVWAARTAGLASDKILASGLPTNPVVNPLVIIKVLDHAQNQAEEEIRELWANLLARELTSGDVHPEIVDVLGRLTTQDAVLLVEIAKRGSLSFFQALSKAMENWPAVKVLIGARPKKPALSHLILQRLGLIRRAEELGWLVTPFGRAFIEAVSPVSSKGSSPTS